MDDESLGVWSRCESLADMGEAMEQWLRGKIEQTPSYLGPPNDETSAIVDDLVFLNRAGVVTTGSQPGSNKIRHADGKDYRQRAYLDAYCDWATAIKVVAACEAVDGLSVHSQLVSGMPVEFTEDELYAVPRIPVSVRLRDDRVKTSMPLATDRCESDMHFGHVGEGARVAGESSMLVNIVDMVWGRERFLWDTLVHALR